MNRPADSLLTEETGLELLGRGFGLMSILVYKYEIVLIHVIGNSVYKGLKSRGLVHRSSTLYFIFVSVPLLPAFWILWILLSLGILVLGS